jgi:hypothetical protein
VKEPRHDDERLAALLEGRLEGPERDELLAYLATADEDLHVFAKTAAVLREMEEEEEEQAAQAHPAGEQVELPPPARGAVPPSARSGWRRRKALQAIVPAVLAGLVVLWRLGAAAAPGPLRLAESLQHAERGLPAGWEPAWTGDRGEPGGEGTIRAARAGALLVDLAVAIQQQPRDTLEVQARAAALRDRSRQPNVAGNPLRQIEARASAPATTLQPLLEQASERLEDQLDRDYLRLGAWTEAARLAAVREDAEFFRSRSTRAMLRDAEGITEDNPEAQAVFTGLRAALKNDGAPNWGALKGQIDALMKAIASQRPVPGT